MGRCRGIGRSASGFSRKGEVVLVLTEGFFLWRFRRFSLLIRFVFVGSLRGGGLGWIGFWMGRGGFRSLVFIL